MEQAALTAGWDGAWFRRAYDAFGKPVGSKECTEGQIFIEPQGMCVMAGIGKETGQAAQALKSVEERLDTKYGVVLHQPAYTSYQLNLGEISSYPPGYKENAGIFCHNNPWISCAEAVLGHGDRAFEVYRKTCPAYIEDISEIHRTEPYVYSQMVAGKDAPTFGEAKNSWLTGTAAWTFVNVSQYILGIQPTLDGLKVDPCIPHTLGGFTVTRRYRGATYHIAVDNTAAVQYGVKSVAVDGKPIEGSLLPLAPEGAVVEVQAVPWDNLYCIFTGIFPLCCSERTAGLRITHPAWHHICLAGLHLQAADQSRGPAPAWFRPDVGGVDRISPQEEVSSSPMNRIVPVSFFTKRALAFIGKNHLASFPCMERLQKQTFQRNFTLYFIVPR